MLTLYRLVLTDGSPRSSPSLEVHPCGDASMQISQRHAREAHHPFNNEGRSYRRKWGYSHWRRRRLVRVAVFVSFDKSSLSLLFFGARRFPPSLLAPAHLLSLPLSDPDSPKKKYIISRSPNSQVTFSITVGLVRLIVFLFLAFPHFFSVFLSSSPPLLSHSPLRVIDQLMY